jgi:hypothetical protein
MVSATLGAGSTLTFSLDVGSGFALAATPASTTVARGAPATYNINVTPQFGSFNNPIALACSVAPFGPTCSLSQSSVTPGSAPVSVTLTVATANVARLDRPGAFAPVFAVLAGLPVFGILAGRRKLRGAKRRKLAIFGVLALTVALVGIQTACGGGSSSRVQTSTGGGGGQTRNYTITVTGTSGTITQQTTAALTVTF